jgi:hypothetical protein
MAHGGLGQVSIGVRGSGCCSEEYKSTLKTIAIDRILHSFCEIFAMYITISKLPGTPQLSRHHSNQLITKNFKPLRLRESLGNQGM